MSSPTRGKAGKRSWKLNIREKWEISAKSEKHSHLSSIFSGLKRVVFTGRHFDLQFSFAMNACRYARTPRIT